MAWNYHSVRFTHPFSRSHSYICYTPIRTLPLLSFIQLLRFAVKIICLPTNNLSLVGIIVCLGQGCPLLYCITSADSVFFFCSQSVIFCTNFPFHSNNGNRYAFTHHHSLSLPLCNWTIITISGYIMRYFIRFRKCESLRAVPAEFLGSRSEIQVLRFALHRPELR